MKSLSDEDTALVKTRTALAGVTAPDTDTTTENGKP